MQDKKWYGIESAKVLELLSTDLESGLDEILVAKRQAEFGANELPKPKKDPALVKFFKHFNDVLIYVLLAAAVVTLFLGHYIDTAVILMVVVINAIIGYIQQSKAAVAIRLSTIEIEIAVELMVSKKLPQMREHAIKIKDYESQCDAVLRRSIKNLFQTEKDPIRIIQYKDIYEELEEIADHCQQVANTFESIIMKNA